MSAKCLLDPMEFKREFWPGVAFYDKQKEIIYSVLHNFITVVPAGNKLGKDFVAGFIVPWFFLAFREVRIVTTSVKDRHLDVLWGEIGRFLEESKYPLPFVVTHRDIRKTIGATKISYAIGTVSKKSEGLAGHHAEMTLYLSDEASASDDSAYAAAQGWAKRMLIFGNPLPCENHFRKFVDGDTATKDKGGDIKLEGDDHYHRKVIRIGAEHSPNVRLCIKQMENGIRAPDPLLVRTDKQPWGVWTQREFNQLRAKWEKVPMKRREFLKGAIASTILPGVLTYDEYRARRLTWDKVRQSYGLDGKFYKGAQLLLFPPTWLDRANEVHEKLAGVRRHAITMGCDPAEGGDSSSWAIADHLGLLDLESLKTEDTSEVVTHTIALARKWQIAPENILFDRGGGGKQHADRLRKMGYKVRTVAFGESTMPELKRGLTPIERRKLEQEERYTYVNRRAELYGVLSLKFDPTENPKGFGLPAEGDAFEELRRQLSPIPKLYDPEGRLYLPPKNKKDPDSKVQTLIELLGCSPDEADAAALAVYGMEKKSYQARAGAVA